MATAKKRTAKKPAAKRAPAKKPAAKKPARRTKLKSADVQRWGGAFEQSAVVAPKPDTVLVLRTVDAECCSRDGLFQHPRSIGEHVEAPDWRSKPVCGGGIHGLLWGEGDGGLLAWGDTARWQVYEVDPADGLVEIDQHKCKFRRGVLVHLGDQASATAYVLEHGGRGRAVVGAVVAAGCHRGATAGDSGQATAGDSGQATAGDRGQATAGDSGQATAGYSGQATAGDRGQATAGDSGQATAGDSGQATAGDRGQATAGDRGQATAGDRGQARSGERGVIAVGWWDVPAGRLRLAVGYIGENGIKPNTFYRANERGELVEVT